MMRNKIFHILSFYTELI